MGHPTPTDPRVKLFYYCEIQMSSKGRCVLVEGGWSELTDDSTVDRWCTCQTDRQSTHHLTWSPARGAEASDTAHRRGGAHCRLIHHNRDALYVGAHAPELHIPKNVSDTNKSCTGLQNTPSWHYVASCLHIS